MQFHLTNKNSMNINKSKFTQIIYRHLEDKLKTIHSQFKGQHKFLNNFFFSPGDERYGFFDRTHTYKTIASLHRALEFDGYKFFLTDIEFDADMSVLYLFDIESTNSEPINSAAFNTTRSILRLTKPRYLID